MVAWRGLGVGLAVAVLATFGLASSALADGGPRRGGKIQECCIDWGGLYFGVHAGYLWSDADWHYPVANTRTSSEQDAAIAGVQIGLQHQWGNVLIGIEAGLTSSLGRFNYDDLCPNPAFHCEHRIDNILTLGGRLGWTAHRWMGYVTAGYAGAAVHTQTRFNQPPALVGVTFDKARDRHDGWYVGVGADWAIHCCDSNWTIGIEYRHYQFEDTLQVPHSTTGVLIPTERRFIDANADTVTVRLNFKIGRAAQPLK